MSDSAVAPELEAVARGALAEVTPPETIGDLLETAVSADEVVDLAFDSRLPGYVGWRWTVSVARLPDESPSVLEVELLPGAGALVAPTWVPWADRLAEYRRTHPDEVVDEVAEEIDEDDLDADEDVLEETDDELDGVEFETPADEDDLEDEFDADDDDEDDLEDADDEDLEDDGDDLDWDADRDDLDDEPDDQGVRGR